MTRVNVGVDPSELPDRLLLAEHREITRIPNAVTSGRAKLVNIPQEFTLGAGHVKFFYDKLGYLKSRYEQLYHECIRRGFRVTNKSDAFIGVTGDYVETGREREIIVARINSKGFHLITQEVTRL